MEYEIIPHQNEHNTLKDLSIVSGFCPKPIRASFLMYHTLRYHGSNTRTMYKKNEHTCRVASKVCTINLSKVSLLVDYSYCNMFPFDASMN